ncbi:MAG: hypothetical protein J7527_08825 [Chitinophagaceae bacterium]|nr:hypothetical protein [Chitinophagaceae bacterium]
MDISTMLPQLKTETVQEKINEAAMKGAMEVIKDFYTSYDSPYKKAIRESLENKDIGVHIQLPDILGRINDLLSAEIDVIANTAVAKTFVPIVTDFLTRADAEMRFSDLIKGFVEETEQKYEEDCSIELKEDPRWGWITVTVSGEEHEYQFTMHLESSSEKSETKKNRILGLPYEHRSNHPKMKLTIGENATLELPFTTEILKDKFTRFVARLVIARTLITIDQTYFDADMFPDRCHCD